MKSKLKKTAKRKQAGRTRALALAHCSAKPWPEHKAREIRGIVSHNLVGWSIYPEQIPAMLKAMGDVIYDDVLTSGDAPANCARKALAAIGISSPNVADEPRAGSAATPKQ